MYIGPLITPIPEIINTPSTVEIHQATITAAFAVASGFILYLLKSIIDGYWLRHLRKFKSLKAEVTYLLLLHARVYTNIIENPDKLHEEARLAFRDVGSRIGAFAIERPKVCWGVPSQKQISDAAIEFVELSNRMYFKGRAGADKLCDQNKKSVDKIKKLMRLE